MPKLIELSWEDFSKIGFGEAHLFFSNPNMHRVGCSFYPFFPFLYDEDIYSIDVWGINFSNDHFQSKLNTHLSTNVNIYASGMMRFYFLSVKNIDIEIMLYRIDDSGVVEFLQDKNGKHVYQNVKMPSRRSNSIDESKGNNILKNDTDSYSYLIEGVSHFPFGFCQIKFNAKQKIFLSQSVNMHFVSTSEYTKNPKVYSFDESKITDI